MDLKRQVVRHFLAALAYRTEKALRDAPETFPDFRAMGNVRTPHEILWHMTGVLGYARTFFVGGVWRPERISFSDEVHRFHELLQDLDRQLDAETALNGISLEQMLQGPLSDAMTHAGQLAMLRRFAGSPVPSENFIFADIRTGNLGREQPLPVAPDLDWTPDRPPHAPGRRRATR
jgi:hypothetical protein